MNNQFDKLVYESGLVAQGCWDKFDEYDKQALNKFAELIVRECAGAIINDRRLNDVRSAANGCVRTINEHFGVEE